jgi:hypothetical protein
MSASNESGLDTWWPVLLVLFGLTFLTILLCFSPTI